MQTKIGSLIESTANTVVGYVVFLMAQIVVFPMFGIFIDVKTNALIGLCFSGVSLLKMFVLRRYFNGMRFFNKK